MTATHTCRTAPLDSETLLQVVGPDAARFLQGQVTCDVTQLSPQRALPGAYCTPQGRMVCDFLLCQLEEERLALRLRRDICEHSAAVLGKYIVFSRAELQQNAHDWQLLACWGEGAREALSATLGEVPDGRWRAVAGKDHALVQVDEAGQQFEAYFRDPRQVEALRATSGAGDEAQWRALQLRSGIGRIELTTVEAFIPQALNYDLTGHVSFNKGCYTGQEVVARMHYRGKPKRRAYLGRVACREAPAPATGLYTGDATQAAGQVINAAPAGDAGWLLLFNATAPGVQQGLHLAAADGPSLELLPLPYELPA